MPKTSNATDVSKCKCLSTDFALEQQSWIYTAVWRTPSGHKVRVHVKRNAYDFQSCLTAYGFSTSGMEWNQIIDIPYTAASAASHKVSYVDKNAPIEPFHKDGLMLLERALELLE